MRRRAVASVAGASFLLVVVGVSAYFAGVRSERERWRVSTRELHSLLGGQLRRDLVELANALDKGVTPADLQMRLRNFCEAARVQDAYVLPVVFALPYVCFEKPLDQKEFEREIRTFEDGWHDWPEMKPVFSRDGEMNPPPKF